MKAVRFAEYGGPEVLQMQNVEEPHAGPGQVRITVRAAGVNGIDWKIRAGIMAAQYPLSLPAGTGRDAAGVVDEVGEGVTDVAVGDAVFGSGSATLAELAVLTAWAQKPATLSFEEAAGFPVAVETALRILDLVGVQAGQTLVVSGAAGGVGSAVVQFAVQRGITVVGTASERNQAYLRELGALATTYGDGWVERVRALAPAGVDAALDIAGAGVLPDLVELTGDPAKVVSIADFTAAQYGVQVSTGVGDMSAALNHVAGLVEQGTFTLALDRQFPLTDAAQAQALSAEGHARGRIVVTVP